MTFLLAPMPCGRLTAPRSACSACLGSMPRLHVKFTDGSHFSLRNVAHEREGLRKGTLPSGTFVTHSLYFLPLYLPIFCS